jgi:superfamily II DNA helicase RecQ
MDLAYYSGTPHAKDILQRIREGTQRIVFTSPEALLETVLTPAIYRAAKSGQLAWLVIDEAHMVQQWGG